MILKLNFFNVKVDFYVKVILRFQSTVKSLCNLFHFGIILVVS